VTVATTPIHAHLTRIQHALGVVARRAKDGALHQQLGRRVGCDLEATGYSTLARLRLADGCTISELADGLGMEVSTVSRRVNALEDRGLVQRETGTTDRRTAHPRLTEHGTDVATKLEHGWRDMLAEVAADWSEEDLETFALLFDRFAEDFEQYARANTTRANTTRASRNGASSNRVRTNQAQATRTPTRRR
jgi:DNA-binding MarR family transcriptional regulator